MQNKEEIPTNTEHNIKTNNTGDIKNASIKHSNSFSGIFPFSASPDLTNDQLPGLEVYKDYLDKAFNEPRIRNIIITGGYGIGKSSIIRSYDKAQLNKKPFLYISLADYKNLSKPVEETNKQQNILERRLLMQIYAHCHRKDLPASSFRLIQEHNRVSAIVIALLFFIFSGLLFSIHNFDLLSTIISGEILHRFNVLYAHEPDYYSMLVELNEKIAFFQPVIHIILYAVLWLIATIAITCLVIHSLPRINLYSLKVKSDPLEAMCEMDACNSYIDQNTSEIVYCLEKIASKINYTVVIEDLDRIEGLAPVEIFTRLREINNLVNQRLRKQYLRFIYIANDSMVSQLHHSKFADYIMPVIPRLNANTSEKILRDNIIELHKCLKEKQKSKESSIKEIDIDNRMNYLISIISPYLSDYRLQYAVLNEYALILRLYCENNTVKDVKTEASNILSLAVYKNLFPDDYSKIQSGESGVFPIYNPNAIKSKRDASLLKKLTEGPAPFITSNSLYYSGFSRDSIIDLYTQKLESDFESTVAVVKANEELLIATENKASSIMKEFSKSDSHVNAKRQASIIASLLEKNNYRKWDWLFNNEVSVISVLETLAVPNNIDYIHLFELAGLDVESDYSIFDKCKGMTSAIYNARDLTVDEYTILCLGVGQKYDKRAKINVKKEDGVVETKMIVRCEKYCKRS